MALSLAELGARAIRKEPISIEKKRFTRFNRVRIDPASGPRKGSRKQVISKKIRDMYFVDYIQIIFFFALHFVLIFISGLIFEQKQNKALQQFLKSKPLFTFPVKKKLSSMYLGSKYLHRPRLHKA